MDYVARDFAVNFVVDQTESCFNVSINNDNVPEMVECFFVNAAPVTSRVDVDPDEVRICIRDPIRKCTEIILSLYVHVRTLSYTQFYHLR